MMMPRSQPADTSADVRPNDGRVLSVISYNMHGFNGGYPTVRDYILQDRPDIFSFAGTLADTSELV